MGEGGNAARILHYLVLFEYGQFAAVVFTGCIHVATVNGATQNLL